MFTRLKHDQMTLTLLLMWVVFVALVVLCHHIWFRRGGRLLAPPKAKYSHLLPGRFRRRSHKGRPIHDKAAEKHEKPD